MLSPQGPTNEGIAAELGFKPKKAALWWNRWLERTQEPSLTQDEQGRKLSDRQLMPVLEEIFTDATRSGSPPRITQEERLRLQALACQSPEGRAVKF